MCYVLCAMCQAGPAKCAGHGRWLNRGREGDIYFNLIRYAGRYYIYVYMYYLNTSVYTYILYSTYSVLYMLYLQPGPGSPRVYIDLYRNWTWALGRQNIYYLVSATYSLLCKQYQYSQKSIAKLSYANSPLFSNCWLYSSTEYSKVLPTVGYQGRLLGQVRYLPMYVYIYRESGMETWKTRLRKYKYTSLLQKLEQKSRRGVCIQVPGFSLDIGMYIYTIIKIYRERGYTLLYSTLIYSTLLYSRVGRSGTTKRKEKKKNDVHIYKVMDCQVMQVGCIIYRGEYVELYILYLQYYIITY